MELSTQKEQRKYELSTDSELFELKDALDEHNSEGWVYLFVRRGNEASGLVNLVCCYDMDLDMTLAGRMTGETGGDPEVISAFYSRDRQGLFLEVRAEVTSIAEEIRHGTDKSQWFQVEEQEAVDVLTRLKLQQHAKLTGGSSSTSYNQG